MRAALGGLVACAVLCAASVVEGAADPPTAVDRRHHVRFTLDGRSLHVRVRPSANARDAFDGKRIDAICSETWSVEPESRVIASLDWPAGSNGQTFDFGRDISRRVKWCLLEHGAKNLAYATFAPLPGYLRVRKRVDESGGIPIEGALQYFRLRDASGRVVLRLRGTRFTRQLPPGRYSLATWHRRCGGDCSTFGRPTGYAKRRFRVRSNETTRLRVTVNYSRGTRISVVG
jgi:diadenosine tetraphosphatase ApaH/serine/threonine PP2A family protein phosphatase